MQVQQVLHDRAANESYGTKHAERSLYLQLQVEGGRKPHFQSMQSEMDAGEDPMHQEDAEVTEGCPGLRRIQELATTTRSQSAHGSASDGIRPF